MRDADVSRSRPPSLFRADVTRRDSASVYVTTVTQQDRGGDRRILPPMHRKTSGPGSDPIGCVEPLLTFEKDPDDELTSEIFWHQRCGEYFYSKYTNKCS